MQNFFINNSKRYAKSFSYHFWVTLGATTLLSIIIPIHWLIIWGIYKLLQLLSINYADVICAIIGFIPISYIAARLAFSIVVNEQYDEYTRINNQNTVSNK